MEDSRTKTNSPKIRNAGAKTLSQLPMELDGNTADIRVGRVLDFDNTYYLVGNKHDTSTATAIAKYVMMLLNEEKTSGKTDNKVPGKQKAS